MILLCENSLKAEQEESIKQKKPNRQKECKLNLKKENELKSKNKNWIYYCSAGAVVTVIALIIYFVIKGLKNKSIHDSSSEEESQFNESEEVMPIE